LKTIELLDTINEDLKFRRMPCMQLKTKNIKDKKTGVKSFCGYEIYYVSDKKEDQVKSK
jgi:hypothetical protein